MDINQFAESFKAFNINGLNSLIYAFASNWWLFLLVIGAISTSVMALTSKIGSVVREEQNVI